MLGRAGDDDAVDALLAHDPSDLDEGCVTRDGDHSGVHRLGDADAVEGGPRLGEEGFALHAPKLARWRAEYIGRGTDRSSANY